MARWRKLAATQRPGVSETQWSKARVTNCGAALADPSQLRVMIWLTTGAQGGASQGVIREVMYSLLYFTVDTKRCGIIPLGYNGTFCDIKRDREPQ
jgi:hypothetical protein